MKSISAISAISAIVVSSLALAHGQDAPKKLEAPLKVHVFTVPSPGAEKFAKKAEETVAKQIKKRKGWFQLVDDKASAELIVEVYQQGIGASESTNAIGAPKGGSGGGLAIGATPGLGGGGGHVNAGDIDASAKVERGRHFFETEVSFVPLGRKLIVIGTASANRRPTSAAADLAKQIEQYCKDNYQDIAARR